MVFLRILILVQIILIYLLEILNTILQGWRHCSGQISLVPSPSPQFVHLSQVRGKVAAVGTGREDTDFTVIPAACPCTSSVPSPLLYVEIDPASKC